MRSHGEPVNDRVYLSPPDVGPLERERLLRAFDSGWIAPVGPDLDEFEQALADLCGWPGVVALSSGTAALHLALVTLGVESGDDVFVSTFTFAATANAVMYCGANPVFIDSEPSSWNMNPDLLAEALESAAARGRLPKAVVVVDLYGQCADYERIVPICREHGVPIVEDAAEAVGSTSRGQAAGTFGDIGVFSFNGNKIMTTSGGGAALTPSIDQASRIRYLATQARQPVAYYEHTEIGFNYRLSNLLAAIGAAQLERLPAMIARRRDHFDRYRSRLGATDGVSFMPVVDAGWNGWLTCLTFDNDHVRQRVEKRLDAANIECRPLWKPMHLQPVFADAPRIIDGTSDRLFERGMCLPSGSALSNDVIDRVAELMSDELASGNQ